MKDYAYLCGKKKGGTCLHVSIKKDTTMGLLDWLLGEDEHKKQEKKNPFGAWDDYHRNASMDRDKYGYNLDDDYRSDIDNMVESDFDD